MAIRTLSGFTPEWWTPESQEGEDAPARFLLKPLNAQEMEEVYDLDAEGNLRYSPSRNKHVLRMGLSGWENILDENDKAVKCTAHNHRYLPMTERLSIASRVLEISSLTEDEIKNL